MKYIKRMIIPVICVSAFFGAGCSMQSAEETTVSEDTTVTEGTGSLKSETSPVRPVETTGENGVSADKDFFVSGITDDIFKRMDGYSYSADCTTPRDELRYVHVLHKDIDGVTHEGELVCNKAIAHDVVEILKELYEESYPIEKMVLVDEYDADDEASMKDNNSSAFNFRDISGTEDISMHGEGLAVDINPLYNPFVTYDYDREEWYVEPDTSWDYVDRDGDFPYKIEADDLCVRLFKKHGFKWGGDWEEEQDYQHFEKTL